jgi:DNA-binding IclR family transcriptional regulator
MPILQKELKFNARQKDDRLISSMADADTLIHEVRTRGLGRVTGEMTPGIHALAAPILNHRGYPAAVVAITGAGDGFDSSFQGNIANLLRKMAARASVEMGYSSVIRLPENKQKSRGRTPGS